jgi:hypothetical protein
MLHGLSARRATALASVALAAFGLVSLCGTGSAVAADRIVIAENFTATS